MVRPAVPGDVPDILRLIRHLATYERQPDAVEATEASLHATFFAEGAQVFAHVAEAGGAIVGVAVWFLNYSTWTGRPGIYLEDLVVDEAARGTGAGKALFRALAREAVTRGCARIDWAVLDWNESAMNFYRTIGGRPQSGWQPWRLDEAGIKALAA
ncbi:GNAT family N-acetyltransferase [Sphingomonas sp. AP4-R1]|uniref:GNAT family N-acetyltransferase n=1 Tax=Sphingomonas sp. AP4-R1 TaxID=2735134 RepID=UPI001493876B|nr:GNAT family N-acetyltransferase [Sphingomonas sp. AP4-R1]QJU60710.1 GNAT family N-acetyltransferase [Sphingomonas sp. AP4-R1]